MNASSNCRTSVIEAIELLSSPSAQIKYEKDVPHAFVVAELFEIFSTDCYHPKNIDFINSFSEIELKDLACLYGFLHIALEKGNEGSIHTVAELQKTPEWRRVILFSKEMYARLTRI